MKTSIPTTTRLELQLVNNCDIDCQGKLIELRGRRDVGVLVLVTVMGERVIGSHIVAVVTDDRTFMELRAFVKQDGGITLDARVE